MNFYLVNTKYINYLREVEPKVLNNKDGYFQRPYVGIITQVNSVDYLIPLASPRGRFNVNKQQYHRILDGKKLISVLKFNNMIPVTKLLVQKIDFYTITDIAYKNLLELKN